MQLPFTIKDFISTFVLYNVSIWPVQVIAYLAGIIALISVFEKMEYTDNIVSAVLSLFWLWTGAVYHLMFFSRINPVAYVFGALFIIQGILFLYDGLISPKLSFGFTRNVYAVFGVIFAVYALLIYPLIGYYLGHGYPRSPGFGVAPCPVTIFTFGLLLLTDWKVPKYLLIIPFLWSLLGLSAALSLGIREDLGLIVAGVLGTLLIIIRDLRFNRE